MGPIHVAGCTTKTAVSRRRQRLSRGVRPNDEGSCYSQIWTALSGHDRQRSAWPAPAITSHRQPVRLSAGAVSAAFDANGQPQQIWSIADDAATLPAEGWSCETTLGHRALYVRALCRAGNSAGRPRLCCCETRCLVRVSFCGESPLTPSLCKSGYTKEATCLLAT